MKTRARYTLAQTRSSLIAAAVICAVYSITEFFDIRWMQAASFGLAEGESVGAVGALFGYLGLFLDPVLPTLAVIGGPIAAYRGALKLGLPLPATIGIVLISFYPPVAVIVHGVLLFQLHQKRSTFGNEAQDAAFRINPIWIAAAVCFAVALVAQFFSFSSARKAEAAYAEMNAIGQSGVNTYALQNALQNEHYFADYLQSLQNQGRDNAIRRNAANAQVASYVRSTNQSIHVSNLAVLAALGCTIGAGVAGARARKHAPVARPSYPIRLPTPPLTRAPSPSPTPPPAPGSRAMPPPWPGAAQPTEEPKPREFFLIRNNERCGPYSESVLRSLIQAGEVQETDFCWIEGWDDWKPVSQAWK